MLLNTKTSAYVLIGESTFNEVNDCIAPVSIYFLKYFILVHTFMTKFSPKRNNYFFFFQPKGLWIVWKLGHIPMETLHFIYIFVPLMVSTFFQITFLFLESFLSQENNFVDFFYSIGMFFFCFFDCFKFKSQIKSLKTLHSGILPCAHTHFWLQHINT